MPAWPCAGVLRDKRGTVRGLHQISARASCFASTPSIRRNVGRDHPSRSPSYFSERTADTPASRFAEMRARCSGVSSSGTVALAPPAMPAPHLDVDPGHAAWYGVDGALLGASRIFLCGVPHSMLEVPDPPAASFPERQGRGWKSLRSSPLTCPRRVFFFLPGVPLTEESSVSDSH